MKLTITTLIMIPLIVLASCKSTPEGDAVKTGDAQEVANGAASATYAISSNTSSMKWIGTKLSTHHHGDIQIKSGELSLNEGKLVSGKFLIDMYTIAAKDVGSEEVNSRLTGHLTSPDFFDVATYPEASFEITSVKEFSGTVTDADAGAEEISAYKVADPNYVIAGNLRIKDVTKNIEFPAKVVVGENGIEATAKFNIDRKLWNITYPGMPDDLIQDLIWFGISIKAEAPAQTALNE